MSKKASSVYQFKITLDQVKPRIWRRILIPRTYNFSEFHEAIQDAMGWFDCHLHEFTLTNPKTLEIDSISQMSDESYDDDDMLDGSTTYLKDYFGLQNTKASYVYDFGDNWSHKIILEKILPMDYSVQYPRCTGGKRCCPPEDCGGPHGYSELLEILSNRKDERRHEIIDWIGSEFEPDYFQFASD